jgi:sRNA-binding regulator protein Hfq
LTFKPKGNFLHPNIRLLIETMPDSSAIPVRRVYDAHPAKAKPKVDGPDPSTLASVSPAGPRKLIRPQLPSRASASRYPALLSAVAPVHPAHPRWGSSAESSHAEAFYFQKQIQSQTLMTFVLEDGEQIEGTIEWYDRNAIKVRRGKVRTLIYKAGIKYLYKAEENSRV